jgi:hypothetical protein
MPFERRVRGLEVSWEDSVVVDELSEEWRSRRDVAWIDGSDFDDSEGSFTPLIDSSVLDEQDLGDRQLGLDAAGLIHYPEDTVVYGRIPFGNGCEPVRAFETMRGVRGSSESRSFVIMLGCAPTSRFCDLQRAARLLVACSSLLGIEDFRRFSMPHMWVVLVGA